MNNTDATEQSNTPTPRHEFDGHQQEMSRFVFLHDNIHMVSCSENGEMRKWDCKTGLSVGQPWGERDRGVCALALAPDGKTIACGGYDGSVQRWSTNGEVMAGMWTGHSDFVLSLSWSPSGHHIASGSADGIILIRNAESEKVEVGPIKTDQRWIYGLAYSPLDDKIASGGKNGTICIWDAHTGECLVGPIDDLGFVFSVVWSLDGSKLYTADRFVRVLDSNSGAELHRFENFNFPYSVALSPKHNLLAAVGQDGVTQLWDTESRQSLGHSFRHEDRQKLRYVSFSQDGRYLAYGGDNNKITLWMVKDIIPEIEVLLGVDATDPIVPPADQFDNTTNLFGSSELLRPFAVNDFPPLQHPSILSSWRLWNIFPMFSFSNLRCTRTKVNDDDPLCSTCSALDLRAIIRNGTRENAIPLGYVTDIVKKCDQCGLCRLIATYLSQRGINLRRTSCSLYTPRELTRESTASHGLMIIESALGGFNLEIRLLGGAGSNVWGPKWSHSQRITQDVDTNQLKRWIHTCKKKHRESCESDWWRNGKVLPNTARVLDVDHMAIIPVPPSCRFVTLSYVWGGTGEGFWTTRTNLNQRSAPGGLDASILPSTLSDTILLVRQLGERYLWIDSLCIVQDDPADKAVQISAMELIYGSSEFTIFAAAGSSSRDPLPGVRPGTRDPKQHIAKIQGLHLTPALPDPQEAITNSTWNERGWTYQEVMLSRRRVFFTARQVYFECKNETRSEEMLPQLSYRVSRVGTTGLGQIIPKNVDVHLTCESYLLPYMKIVEESTQRKLTFESDIVDAVDALLRGLTSAFKLADGDYNKAFRFGMLLTGCLDDALVWQPKTDAPHSRRMPTTDMKVLWPSWSWAAWRGAVRYASDEVFNYHHQEGTMPRFKFGQPLVEWYIVDDNGQIVRQYVEHQKGINLEPNPNLTTHTMRYVAPKGDIDRQQLMINAPLVPGTLVFRTSCSRFDVTRWVDNAQNANPIANYAIYSVLSDIPRPSTMIGRIILPSSTHSPASYEFIILSRSTERTLVHDEERLGKRYSGCLLYVMAVQKMQDEIRSERVGVGVIFEQAWVKSAPEEKIIYLG